MNDEVKDLKNCSNQKKDLDNFLTVRVGEIQNELYSKINQYDIITKLG